MDESNIALAENEAVAGPESALVPESDNDSLATVEAEGSAQAEGRGLILPYVGLYGERARKETRLPLDAAGVQVGDFYLHHITPIALKPFDLHLLKYTRLYTKQDNNMNIVAAAMTSDNEQFKAGFREHLFCVVAVRLPIFGKDGNPTGQIALVPATLGLRSALTKALKNTLAAWEFAKNPGAWAARGKAYAESVEARYPGGRMVTTIWAESVDQNDGTTFNMGHDSIRPTRREDAEAFNAWVDSSRRVIDTVIARMDERVAEAKKKLV